MALKVVIGLEMHCELNTKTKVFSKSLNNYNDIPNSSVTAIDLAFPGTLPIVNKEAVKKAIKMALCLNCKIPEELIFDRKNYYYPDVPKNYQITQNTKPIGLNGKINVEVNNELVPITIHDIHLEEDTASLDHYFDYSLIDYNRSGVPLLEIVTDPCIYSPEAAVAFLEHLRNIYKYTDCSEADTKKGQIRCDVNVSLKEENATELGTKVEVKNVNSFSNVYAAILYEIKRQTELIEAGKNNEIIQETRRWDEESGATIRMREKVESIDYKYYVDPNIPKIKIEKEWIEEIKSEIPLLPLERKTKYIEDYNLSSYDAGVLVKTKEVSDYFEECLELGMNPKEASNWITSQIMGYINKYDIEITDIFLTPKRLLKIINFLNNNTISSKQAKELFFLVLEEKEEPEVLIKKYGIEQIVNNEELLAIIQNIVDNNQSQIEEYKAGKTKVFDYFIGMIMKETKGKANPVKVKEILLSKLK
ncbi:MAG: Asp-tRNA(Asn)/Glu-tRNA(Gln) amidotransferase subunit GatB [Bacilli bacterium]|nr:Asp-tRNA(Asn)/Glu-tRNA(Gln) amidotransferase subunit GatB [Bacilli bacterium]MDD3895475.1 Asp-tRNA(Asn)/Glu-tRNA(Gln) amidotransferase subunit GatB [Bacilli bacterium]